jgi:hypothetical protein
VVLKNTHKLVTSLVSYSISEAVGQVITGHRSDLVAATVCAPQLLILEITENDSAGGSWSKSCTAVLMNTCPNIQLCRYSKTVDTAGPDVKAHCNSAAALAWSGLCPIYSAIDTDPKISHGN